MAQSPLWSLDRLRFAFSRIKERLWVKPLVLCVVSIAGTFIARLADDTGLSRILPEVTLESVETLLSIMASSMLVIATFAVGSMVAAYASASAGATPRSIPLVIDDDVTQNALSAFIGAFIFSIVSLITIQNDLFGSAGRFAIFVLTLLVFVIVVITFVRWVDRIARLGRVVNTIAKAEKAAGEALDRRRHAPTLGALAISALEARDKGTSVCSSTVGYVQHIDLQTLQSRAEALDCRVMVTSTAWHLCGVQLVHYCVLRGALRKPMRFSRAPFPAPSRSVQAAPLKMIPALGLLRCPRSPTRRCRLASMTREPRSM